MDFVLDLLGKLHRAHAWEYALMLGAPAAGRSRNAECSSVCVQLRCSIHWQRAKQELFLAGDRMRLATAESQASCKLAQWKQMPLQELAPVAHGLVRVGAKRVLESRMRNMRAGIPYQNSKGTGAPTVAEVSFGLHTAALRTAASDKDGASVLDQSSCQRCRTTVRSMERSIHCCCVHTVAGPRSASLGFSSAQRMAATPRHDSIRPGAAHHVSDCRHQH